MHIFKKMRFVTVFADLNLLDWSVNNHLAVALGGNIYLWNAGSGDISPLLESESADEYVSSVAWIKQGNILAVGTSNAEIQVCCFFSLA